jgi:hypothetical protein
MKNTATNTLGYTGIVTLSQYINSKKLKIAQMHNEGSYPLFNFLSDCLIGDFAIAELDIPEKIMLLSRDTAGEDYIDVSGFIYLLSKPEKVYNRSVGTVRYSFIVPKTKLISAEFSHIGLYTRSATEAMEYAAICEVNFSKLSKLGNISTSSALVVDWELTISNKDKETT